MDPCNVVDVAKENHAYFQRNIAKSPPEMP